MTKRQLRKAAHTKIVREGMGHQEAFDGLRKERGTATLDELAMEVSKIPSKAKWHDNRVWIAIFIASLALIIVLRGLGIFIMGQQLNANTPVFLMLIVAGLLMPVIGIVFLATKRIDQMKFISILFILSIVRSFKDIDFEDPFTLVGLAPYIPALILGFWLPEKMKTPYTKTVEYAVRDNEKVGVTKVIFEEKAFVGTGDLIDGSL